VIDAGTLARPSGLPTAMLLAIGLVLAGGSGALAGADTEPVIVVPGRPDVPVIINGVDVRGAVIEGDWGLARGSIGLTIIKPWVPIHPYGRWAPGSLRHWGWKHRERALWSPEQRGGFYPRTGRPPPVGRLEIVPPADRELPPPAEYYQRYFGVESAPLPATIAPPFPYGARGATPTRQRANGYRDTGR
jgi:hypothetical protein